MYYLLIKSLLKGNKKLREIYFSFVAPSHTHVVLSLIIQGLHIVRVDKSFVFTASIIYICTACLIPIVRREITRT